MPVDENPGPDHDTNLLAAYFEDRLALDERRGVEEHLAACRDCRDTLAAWAMAGSQSTSGRRLALPDWLGMAASLALAGLIGYQVAFVNHSVSGPPPGVRQSEPPRTESAHPTEPASAQPPSSPSRGGRSRAEEPLAVQRGGERRVGSKTFQLVAGEWIDSSFDPIAGLPVVEARGPEERRAAVARVPELAPYARLGDHVTVVVGNLVYRFLP